VRFGPASLGDYENRIVESREDKQAQRGGERQTLTHHDENILIHASQISTKHVDTAGSSHAMYAWRDQGPGYGKWWFIGWFILNLLTAEHQSTAHIPTDFGGCAPVSIPCATGDSTATKCNGSCPCGRDRLHVRKPCSALRHL
jgi:hypothetical protein